MNSRTLSFGLWLLFGCLAVADFYPVSSDEVEWQPLQAQIRRLDEALQVVGVPLSPSDLTQLRALARSESTDRVKALQKILDPYCLMGVHVNAEMRVKVAPGPARPELLEKGWRIFLVKVQNESGATSELKLSCPQALPLHNSPQDQVADRWLDLSLFNAQPLPSKLSGLALEYKIVQLYSRDAGKREATISFNIGQGTQDLGFRNEASLLFTAIPSQEIQFSVKDENGISTMGSFKIRDDRNRIYPAQTKRLAPDFSFHPQIYRGEGETIRLPQGQYTVEFSRGPESLTEVRTVKVDARKKQEWKFQVKRWIDPSLQGWWSGDHHIHAAGCAHYEKPTEGVHAPDMMRHILGEDLKVGCNLTWGPCFDYQKQFFTGKNSEVSKAPYLLRYDVEVSGFGSHQSGHLCLLRLKEQIPPGGDSKNHWPTLGLNTLKWAKKQGAVVGPAHSGWGLEVNTTNLPNFIIPPFAGIGAMEYIVDVTHQLPGADGQLEPAVDFLSMVDTPYVWELNIWYHTLNVGYRTRISGETDFPCIYGDKVGLGRSYVKQDGELNYESWCEGIRQGRNYVSDGKSHLMGFAINEVVMGENGSVLKLSSPGKLKAKINAAARLDVTPRPEIRSRPYTQQPYWDLERARQGDSRIVAVELIVNGVAVQERSIVADGSVKAIDFDFDLKESSWVAVRILPSSHTNPIFVEVAGRPIRASRKSAQWCLDSVDKCWKEKQKFIRADEREEAIKAYDHARNEYRRILGESKRD